MQTNEVLRKKVERNGLKGILRGWQIRLLDANDKVVASSGFDFWKDGSYYKVKTRKCIKIKIEKKAFLSSFSLTKGEYEIRGTIRESRSEGDLYLPNRSNMQEGEMVVIYAFIEHFLPE